MVPWAHAILRYTSIASTGQWILSSMLALLSTDPTPPPPPLHICFALLYWFSNKENIFYTPCLPADGFISQSPPGAATVPFSDQKLGSELLGICLLTFLPPNSHLSSMILLYWVSEVWAQLDITPSSVWSACFAVGASFSQSLVMFQLVAFFASPAALLPLSLCLEEHCRRNM